MKGYAINDNALHGVIVTGEVNLEYSKYVKRWKYGHLYINNLPNNIRFLLLKGNYDLKHFDLRSLEGKRQFESLMIDDGVTLQCPLPKSDTVEKEYKEQSSYLEGAGGCRYEMLSCVYDRMSKTLDCSNRNLTGPIYIYNVPNDCEYLDLSNNQVPFQKR